MGALSGGVGVGGFEGSCVIKALNLRQHLRSLRSQLVCVPRAGLLSHTISHGIFNVFVCLTRLSANKKQQITNTVTTK